MSHSQLELDRLVEDARSRKPDWGEVLRRADRPTEASAWSHKARRWGAFALAAAALLLVVSPAIGFDRPVISFFTSDPAPEPVRVAFAQLDQGAPSGMESHVDGGQARRVTSVTVDGQVHDLWVAPTAKGGFCLTWEGLTGGCWADRRMYERSGTLIGGTWMGSPSTTKYVAGQVIAPGTRSVDVLYEDGERDTVDLFWVSAPIDAGFFLFEVPVGNRQVGQRAVALVARDADGRVIAREDRAYSE